MRCALCRTLAQAAGDECPFDSSSLPSVFSHSYSRSSMRIESKAEAAPAPDLGRRGLVSESFSRCRRLGLSGVSFWCSMTACLHLSVTRRRPRGDHPAGTPLGVYVACARNPIQTELRAVVGGERGRAKLRAAQQRGPIGLCAGRSALSPTQSAGRKSY
jgi:hypothetical protein